MLRGRKDDPGFLFLSQRGNPFDRSSLNKCALHQVARLLPKRAGISGYTFRHTVASHLLANDVDVTYIAKLLGHESLRTTQRYLRVEIGDLKRMHGLYHPRERLGDVADHRCEACGNPRQAPGESARGLGARREGPALH